MDFLKKVLKMFTQGRGVPVRGFLSSFFRTTEEDYTEAEYVEIDVERNTEAVAPTLSDARTGAIIVNEEVWTENKYRPPYSAMKDPINLHELMERQPGESDDADSVGTWFGRLVRKITRILTKYHRMFARNIELQCAQALQTGHIQLTDDKNGITYDLDYHQSATHLPTATPAWGSVGATPVADITALCDVIAEDGPQEFHDEYRRNRQGRPSFVKVMQGINLLKKHGVEWNGMAVVNDYNADYPLEFYRFFKEIGCHYIQFAPIVERIYKHADGRHLATPLQAGDKLADFSVTPEQWGNFLCTLFDEWVRKDVGTYFIQLFDSTLANWVGEQPGVCSLAKTCGHAGVIEFNGDVYACDHFVFPEFKLGNLYEKTLVEMMYSERQQAFGQAKQSKLPTQCQECEFLFACNGECPKNRFAVTADGEPGLNYLCKGYHQFFNHVAPYMDYMKRELLAERAPANIMEAIREGKI